MATRQNTSAKAPGRKTTRANLLLDAEAHQRLFVHALMTNQAAGEIVSRLISEYLREFALPAKLSGRTDKSHRAIPNDPVIENATPLPLQGAA